MREFLDISESIIIIPNPRDLPMGRVLLLGADMLVTVRSTICSGGAGAGADPGTLYAIEKLDYVS